jgi:hypothetical protein
MSSRDWHAGTEQALQQRIEIPEPDPLRQASARRAFLEQASRLRAKIAAGRQPRLHPRLALLRLAAVLSLTFFLAFGMLTGVAAAADRALPGDLLYPLDLAMETAQLSFTQRPAARVALLLDLADERLEESRLLVEADRVEQIDTALDGYDRILEDLSATIEQASTTDQPVLDTRIEETLRVNTRRLVELRQEAPEQALPGLDRAIEASQGGRDSGQSERTPGPPEDRRPEKTPGPPEGHPGNPHGNPHATKGSP